MGNIANIKDKVEQTKLLPIELTIKKSVQTLSEALPKHMNAERLVRIALTTMRLNPELYKCTPQSFMGALFQSAQLGLEPNIEGQAYIIPFNNKRNIGTKENPKWQTVKEAQFQIGYKGYVDLFYRHKDALSLDMQKVRYGDEFDFEYGTSSYLRHKPVTSPVSQNEGEVFGYYAVAHLRGGACVFKYMNKEECLEHGKTHSKCYDKKKEQFFQYTPWVTNLDAMCMKTVLIQLMKLLPKSFELQKAIAADETIKTSIDKDMFSVKDETVWENIIDEEPGDTGNTKPDVTPTEEEINVWNES